MFDLAPPPRRARRPLIPLVDLIFLILLVAVVAIRQGDRTMIQVELGVDAPYDGPPRLVDLRPSGLSLNGVAMDDRALLTDLVRLSDGGRDAVVLRPGDGTDMRRLLEVVDLMQSAGFSTLSLVGAWP